MHRLDGLRERSHTPYCSAAPGAIVALVGGSRGSAPRQSDDAYADVWSSTWRGGWVGGGGVGGVWWGDGGVVVGLWWGVVGW